MFKSIHKKCFSALLVALSTMSILSADECCYLPEYCCEPDPCHRFYFGAFGGQVFSDSTEFVQRGTAFFTEAEGGPLDVNARGDASGRSSGFGGIQIGYEWKQGFQCSNWSLSPAVEFEALFFHHTYKAHLINPTDRLAEHDFEDTFPTNIGLYIFGGVLSLNNCKLGNFTPYFGVGVGPANIRIRKATSLQVDPAEPGINHFNSDRSDSSWAFAAQAKAGVRYNFWQQFHIFAEYRFLYVDSSDFIFGSTTDPAHVPTSLWNVEKKSNCYNGYAIGIQFDL